MKKTISIIVTMLIILTLTSPAHAGEWFSWDEKNTELHIPLNILFVADLGQTLWIADHCPDEIVEVNYFLGNCPSREEVKEYFGWVVAVSTFITWALESNPTPEKVRGMIVDDRKVKDTWSHWFQKGTITVEVMAVGNNFSFNVGWGF